MECIVLAFVDSGGAPIHTIVPRKRLSTRLPACTRPAKAYTYGPTGPISPTDCKQARAPERVFAGRLQFRARSCRRLGPLYPYRQAPPKAFGPADCSSPRAPASVYAR